MKEEEKTKNENSKGKSSKTKKNELTEKKTPKNKQKLENKTKEQLERIEKEIKNKTELPKDKEENINIKVFKNLLIADVIMIFLFLISLGSLNIETPIFITDLKVFSIALIVFTIILFEYSYKKDNGTICIHGIECLVLAIFTLLSIYLYTIYFKNFSMIVACVSVAFAIYYVGKSIIIYRKMKKQYIAGLNDINEIIKK